MPASLWNDKFIIDVYEYAAQGMTEKQMAQKMGIAFETFLTWERNQKNKKYELFRESLKRGRNQHKGSKEEISIKDYVFNLLPEKEKKYWRQLRRMHKTKVSRKKIQAFFEKRGKKLRQSLWIQAYISCNFSISAANRMVCISYSTLERWKKESDFQGLFGYLSNMEEDFFNTQLVKRCRAGSDTLIKYANERIDKRNGLGQNVNLNVNGYVNHSVKDLDLDLETKKILLEKIRNKK